MGRKLRGIARSARRLAVLGLAGCLLYGGSGQVGAAALKDVFDEKYYADSYADLKEAFGYDRELLWEHFMACGLSEGRSMNPFIDIAKYRASYADLDEAFGDDWDAYLEHYLTFGAKEKRDTGTDFSALDYAERYADLKEAFGDDVLALWNHYKTAGAEEKRDVRSEAVVVAEKKAQAEAKAEAEKKAQEAKEDEYADIVKPDPNKVYDLSYFGMWCSPTYPHDNYVEKMIEKALNLNITVEAKQNDAMKQALVAGEMPDCMWSNVMSVDELYSKELVRTIPRKMVEYYCPTLIKYYDEFPLMYTHTTNADGDFRYLTGFSFQFCDYYLSSDYYRYDWIKKLGIDIGTDVEKIADRIYVAKEGIEWSKFQEIMEKFTTGDPNGDGKQVYGMTAQSPGQPQFYSGFGFHAGVNNVNGKAAQYYVMDEYKEFLKGFAELYKKGYIDPQTIGGNRQLGWDKVNAGTCGYWITSTNALNSWAIDRPPLTLLEKIPEAEILLTPGIRPDGGECKIVSNSTPRYGNFVVNKNVDDELLAKILQFVEYTLFGNGDKDTHASLLYGEKGVDWEWNEAGTMPVKLTGLQAGEKGTWAFGQFGQDRDVMGWTSDEPYFLAGKNYWYKDGSWMKWQTIEYKGDPGNQTEYSNLDAEYGGDIWEYTEAFLSKAITGQIDIDAEWDAYLKQLDDYGYSKMMAELDKLPSLQEIIDSYKKK